MGFPLFSIFCISYIAFEYRFFSRQMLMSPLVTIFDKIKFNCFCGSESLESFARNHGNSNNAKQTTPFQQNDEELDSERSQESSHDVSDDRKTSTEASAEEERRRAQRRKPSDRVKRLKNNAKYDGRHRYTIYDEVSSIGERYNVTILPVHANFCIENLYPETNQVHKWNIIIIGKDKTFVHVSIHDLDLPEYETFVNRRAGNVLDRQLQDFFDPIFDKTLSNQRLQFVMGWSHRIYLVNTYPLNNQFGSVIGAVIFIRNYSLMPKMTFAPVAQEDARDTATNVHRRHSNENGAGERSNTTQTEEQKSLMRI